MIFQPQNQWFFIGKSLLFTGKSMGFPVFADHGLLTSLIFGPETVYGRCFLRKTLRTTYFGVLSDRIRYESFWRKLCGSKNRCNGQNHGFSLKIDEKTRKIQYFVYFGGISEVQAHGVLTSLIFGLETARCRFFLRKTSRTTCFSVLPVRIRYRSLRRKFCGPGGENSKI